MTTQDTVPGHDVAILVVSCDAYQDLWEPFFRCFFKYWPDCPYAIYLGSNYATYPDARVCTLTIGQDVDYSSNLISMLERVDAPWVLLWIEDRVLAERVNSARMANWVAAMQEQGAGFVKLIASHPYSIVATDRKEFGPIPKGQSYRVCMTVGLWHKPTLLKLLKPGETAWQIEREGSKRSNALDRPFCAMAYRLRRNPPVKDMHLIIKGKLLRDARDFLQREGLVEVLDGRSLQTLGSFLYLRTYLLGKDLATGVKSAVSELLARRR